MTNRETLEKAQAKEPKRAAKLQSGPQSLVRTDGLKRDTLAPRHAALDLILAVVDLLQRLRVNEAHRLADHPRLGGGEGRDLEQTDRLADLTSRDKL